MRTEDQGRRTKDEQRQVSDPDVIVVGAGPAGATAARALALGGARVRLLERDRFPRNKPCGGGITMRVMRRFPYLRDAIGRIPAHYVSRLRLESPDGAGVTLESAEPAVLLVRRVEFDELVATLAVEAGAELSEGVAIAQAAEREGGVELRARDGRVFRAPVVIAADGVNGVIARRLGFNPGWSRSSLALDMMEETPAAHLSADPATLWVSYGYGASHGYAYIFPKCDHVNVGVGYLLSDFRQRAAGAPYELQRKLVESLRDRGVVRGASSRAHFTPYLIPVGGPLPVTARGRVLLAGDAGGFVNGYTAEGIYYAMVSGDLAAAAILGDGFGQRSEVGDRHRGHRAPGRRSLSGRYVRAWRREIGGELRDSVLIRRYLFRDVGRVARVVTGAQDYPAVASSIIGYATGAVSYRAARRAVLARFPRVWLRLARLHLLG